MKNTFTLLSAALLAASFSISVLAEQDASAVSDQAQTASAPATAAGTSRIRMFGQNGRYGQIFPGLSCVKSGWSSDGILVSGGAGQAFKSFLGSGSMVSLGMPETDDSKNVSRKDGLLSKAYYQEHAIPSGQVTSLAMAFNDVGSRYGCNIATSFMPEAGADYEVKFWMGSDSCYVNVLQLKKTTNGIETTPVPLQKVQKCEVAPTPTPAPVRRS